MILAIYAPHFSAGVIFEHGRIERTAPIVAWMQKQNWSVDQIKQYCKFKKYELHIIPEASDGKDSNDSVSSVDAIGGVSRGLDAC